MPKISQRGKEMPSSPIRRLAPLANEAKARGVKVYHLNIGQPDLPTPQKALDVLKNVDRTVLEYSPSQGILSLREALVNYYERYQIKLSPDDVIITAGGSEAVLFAFMSCLNPGDEIIDMVGFDCYAGADRERYLASMKNALDITKAFAQEHGKLMAITETGYEGIKDPKWWTEVLYNVMKDYHVSYVLIWRNACDDNMQHHFYAPFPEHESADDFKAFAALDQMLFI